MPTLNLEAPPASREAVKTSPQSRTPSTSAVAGAAHAGLLLLLALAAIAINGYHPYSEDAGIYVAGIKQAANPALYGTSAAFVTAWSRFSSFSAFNAWLAHSLSVSFDVQLLATQILTTWLLLFAAWKLARICFYRDETRWASVILLAVCLSVPVAGSALCLLDPYVTARSFSMPLTLLAVAACLERKTVRAGVLLVLVALFHPLMSIYAAGFVLFLWVIRRESAIGTSALMISAIAAGTAVQFSQRRVIESSAQAAAVATRSYFFLAEWHWYELFGLAAPLALLGIFLYWNRRVTFSSEPAAMLAKACETTGFAAIVIALLFAHPQSRSPLIAVMQPMRAFVLIYVCLFLMLGGTIGEFILKRSAWRWLLLFAGTGAAIGVVQDHMFPNSAHLELPGRISQNDWKQAFLWIRANTPVDAVFALDADYIHAPGEDTQGFRAIAERGSLADASKDGGAATFLPYLAGRWMAEQSAQTGLNTINDGERLRRLTPFHVTWIVLDRNIPYRDAVSARESNGQGLPPSVNRLSLQPALN